jgi:uncharacterized membrane protein
MFKKEMKSLIIFAVSKNISAIETKVGYNGAPILKLCSFEHKVIKELKNWCNNLGFENKVITKDQSDVPIAFKEPNEYCLFCVFGDDTNNNDHYDLL